MNRNHYFYFVLFIYMLIISISGLNLRNKGTFTQHANTDSDQTEYSYTSDGFQSSDNEPATKEKLNVHIIPHTHDDLGWVKTIDEYYVGANDTVENAYAGVQYILDGIYKALMNDPNKKFTYVEIAFFSIWWDEQTDEVKDNVRMLVQEDRLQFVNGGWSMSDESSVYYEDFINNMKKGHDFLNKTFGYKPTVGWQIDTFGHSNAALALFAEMGFEAWFFARGDVQENEVRAQKKELEWIQRPMYENLGNRTEIFSHWFYEYF